MKCSARCCICYAVAVSGGCSRRIFPNGGRCIRTLPNGASLTSTVSAPGAGIKKNQVGAACGKLGRSDTPTLLSVDAQSVKNTDTAGSKGYDAGKKVSGIKRHIGVDTRGLPHAIAVMTAEVTDLK